MKPLTLTALAATGALTVALATVPLGGATLGDNAGRAFAGTGMIACGMVLRRQRRVAAAAECPAIPAPPPKLVPVPRFFPEGGPAGQVIPFGRKAGTMSETRPAQDRVRRAERVCAAARARAEEPVA